MMSAHPGQSRLLPLGRTGHMYGSMVVAVQKTKTYSLTNKNIGNQSCVDVSLSRENWKKCALMLLYVAKAIFEP